MQIYLWKSKLNIIQNNSVQVSKVWDSQPWNWCLETEEEKVACPPVVTGYFLARLDNFSKQLYKHIVNVLKNCIRDWLEVEWDSYPAWNIHLPVVCEGVRVIEV